MRAPEKRPSFSVWYKPTVYNNTERVEDIPGDIEFLRQVYANRAPQIKARAGIILNPRLPLTSVMNYALHPVPGDQAVADAQTMYALEPVEAKAIVNDRTTFGMQVLGDLLNRITPDQFVNEETLVTRNFQIVRDEHYLRYRQFIDFSVASLARMPGLTFEKRFDVFSTIVGFAQELLFQADGDNGPTKDQLLYYALEASALTHEKEEILALGDFGRYLSTQKTLEMSGAYIPEQIETAFEVAGMSPEITHNLEAKGKKLIGPRKERDRIIEVLDGIPEGERVESQLSRWDLRFSDADASEPSNYSIRIRERTKKVEKKSVVSQAVVVKGEKLAHAYDAFVKVKPKSEYYFSPQSRNDEQIQSREDILNALRLFRPLRHRRRLDVELNRIEYKFIDYGVKVSIDTLKRGKGRPNLHIFEIQALSKNIEETPDQVVERISDFMDQYGIQLGFGFDQLLPYTFHEFVSQIDSSRRRARRGHH